MPSRLLLFPLFLRFLNKLLEMSLLLRRASFLVGLALLVSEARQGLRERPGGRNGRRGAAKCSIP